MWVGDGSVVHRKKYKPTSHYGLPSVAAKVDELDLEPVVGGGAGEEKEGCVWCEEQMRSW